MKQTQLRDSMYKEFAVDVLRNSFVGYKLNEFDVR